MVKISSSIKLNLKPIRIRFYSVKTTLKTYNIDEDGFKKVHIAINLLFPGLGHSSVYEITSEFIKEIPPNILQKEKIRKMELIEDSGHILENLEFAFPYLPTSIIDESFYMQIKNEYELIENHNELPKALPKLIKSANMYPLIFCGKEDLIPELFQKVYDQECQNKEEIISILKALKEFGEKSFLYHQTLYNDQVVTLKPGQYEKLISNSFIPKCISYEFRKINDFQTSESCENIFYQWLGFVTLVDGALPKKFMKEFEWWKNVRPDQPSGEPTDLVSKEELIEIKNRLYFYTNFADYSLRTLVHRNFILHETRKYKSEWLKIYKSIVTDQFKKQLNMAIYGYLVLQDSKLESDTINKIIGPSKYSIFLSKPNLSLYQMMKMSNHVNSQDIIYPIISNLGTSLNTHEVPKMIINNNVINKILTLNHLQTNNNFIKNFATASNLAYDYYLRRVITQYKFDEYSIDVKTRLLEILNGSLFKEYYVDQYMKFFNTQKDHTKFYNEYLTNLHKSNYYASQFDQIFGCLSEESKFKFCKTMIHNIFKMLAYVKDDYKLIDVFFKEFNNQLKKRQSKELESVLMKEPLNIVRVAPRASLEVVELKIPEEQLKELTLKFLKFKNAQANSDLNLRQFILMNKSFTDKIKGKVHKEQLIDAGRKLMSNETIDEAYLKSFSASLTKPQACFNFDCFDRSLADLNIKLETTPIETDKSFLQLPTPILDSANKNLLTVCYYIALKFNKKLGVSSLELPEMITKQATVAFEYYNYQVYKQILIHSKMANIHNEQLFYLLTKEKKLFKLINKVNGFDRPLFGDQKLTDTYKRMIEAKAFNEYYDLKFQIQIFNQFLAILLIDNQKGLDEWTENLVKSVLIQVEGKRDIDAYLRNFNKLFGYTPDKL
ncbi:unnamed protein product [Candida verbasci]|uniref:Uncharacterized protein n=1 Tax=Candida verbasci TaxID=1227364 RepID=A0A9W4TXF0_9ASCO|nr:unnamed protein product [Candida verbasci]